ncbi:mitochondrial thiamine pyrophosphate transporter, partial [Linderina pennispora]
MASRQSLPCKTDTSARTLDPPAKPDIPQSSALLTSRTATRQLTSLESAFCGATAGLISRALIAPFDVIKITLQLETRRRSFGILKADGVVECAKQIMQREGVRGFFKGNLSAEYLYLSYGAAQFLVFGAVERTMAQTD